MEEFLSFIFSCLDLGSWVAYFWDRDGEDKEEAKRAEALESRPRLHPEGDRSE